MRQLTKRQSRGLVVLTAGLVVLIGLLVPQCVKAANCPSYVIKVDNPNGEGNQGATVGYLSLCSGTQRVPGPLTLTDTSDTIQEPSGKYTNPGANGSFDKVFAQTIGVTEVGQYWVELRQDGLNQPRCFLYSPGARWREFEVPQGESGFHCYQLAGEQRAEPIDP